MSDHSRLSKVDAKASVEVILEALTKGIVSGEGVEIRGFGGFYKKYRKSTFRHQPKTSERTQVKEKFVPFLNRVNRLESQLIKTNID